MEKTSQKLMAVLLLIGMIGTMFTGCGSKSDEKHDLKYIEKNGIEMENYTTYKVVGQNGYAKLQAEVDFEKLKSDCMNFLVVEGTALPFRRPHCETIEDYIDDVFYYIETSDILHCNKEENLSNGDKLEIVVEVPDRLAALLTVDITPAEITHKVNGLAKFEKIDPFKYAFCSYRELVSIDGEVGYKLINSTSLLVFLPDGSQTNLYATIDVDEDRVYKKSDSVRMTLTNDLPNQRVIDKYGEECFARTEAVVSLENMGYLPVAEYARDAFEYMDDHCLKNVDAATKNMMDSCTNTDTSVERIGMVFFYDDEGVLEERDYPYKFYNQIVFVYKIVNEHNPDGWYSYMAYNGYISVGHQLNEETLEMEKCVGDLYGSHLMNSYRYYQNEHPEMYRGDFASTFICDGREYPGHTALEDVLPAIMSNMQGAGDYDHVIVTDSLQDYVTKLVPIRTETEFTVDVPQETFTGGVG